MALLLALGCLGAGPAGVASAQPLDLCEPGLIQTAGTIATFAGSGPAGFDHGGFGGDGGPATNALLKFPTATAAGQGHLFIADTNNHRVRRVNLATCVIDTIAGTGDPGSTGDGGQALNARLNSPRGVAVADGILYISDTNNHRVRRVNLATGVITLLTNAVFGPQQIEVFDGHLYVAESSAHVVSRIDLATGVIQVVAGTGASGFMGDGGLATSARLSGPRDVAFHGGKMYIADRLNARVRVVDLASGIISTFAGTGFNEWGRDGFPAALVGVTPNSLAVSGDTLLVSDDATSRVRTIDLQTGLINTLAGTGTAGFTGDGGPGPEARVDQPAGLTVVGNALMLAEMFSQRVRRIQLGALQQPLAVQDAPPTARNGTSFTVGAGGGSGSGALSFLVTGGCSNVDGGAEITMTASSGACSIAAAKAGDLDYLPTVSVPVSVTAQPPLATQSPLVVNGAPASAPFAAIFNVSASGGSGTGALSFAASGACATVGGIVGSSILVQMISGTGSCAITAAKAADSTFAAATSAPAIVAAQRVAQAPLVLNGAPASGSPGTVFSLTVSGGSGTGVLQVTAAGACAISTTGNVVTLDEVPGTCTISAQKDGDTDYLDASTTAAVEVAWPPFTISPVPAYAAFGSGFTVGATGGGGTGAVTFTGSGSCVNVDGGPSFTMTSGTGACTITATKAADGVFPGASDTAVVVARRARQAPLAFAGLPVAAPPGTSFPVTVTGGSGTGALTILASGGCTVVAGTVQVTTSSADCRLDAVQAGDANHETARARAGTDVAWSETVLQSTTAASSPSPDLVQAPDGKLYGTTSGGGAFGYGSIFAFDPSTNALAVVYSFGGPDGARPDSGLTLGADGFLYGVTPQGGGPDWLTGTGPRGTVFRFDPGTGVLTTLHVFAFVSGQSFPTGASPGGRLTQASDGMLYGTTSTLGPGGQGTVFRLDPVSGTFATVYAFSTPGPARPESGLVEGPDGALYGTTYNGGAANLGAVFRLEKSGVLTTVRSLSTADGTLPLAELHVEPDGSLYGSTTNGGTHGHGTVFVVSPAGAFTVLHAFTGATSQGGRPAAALVRLQDGDLYGIAPVPGYSWASLFRLTPGGPVASGIALFMLNTRGLLQVDDGTIYGVSPSSNVSITRLTPPPSALVYTRQLQAPLVVTGAPVAAMFSASFTAGTSGGSGAGVVTFSVSGACTNIGPFVTMTSGAGVCSVTATKAGDATYAPATSAPVVVTAQPAPQAPLAILGAPVSAWPGTSFIVSVTGGSGTGATSLVVSGDCGIGPGNTVTLSETPGACTVTAAKAGDANYQPASATVSVGVGWPPLSVTAPVFAVYGASFTVTAEGGFGDGQVTFAASGACEIDAAGATVTMTSGSGTCAITATKAADGAYPGASGTVQVLARRARQAPLELTGLPATATNGSTFVANVTGGTGAGQVTVLAEGGCTAPAGGPDVLMTSGSLPCRLSAVKAGDANYEPARTRPGTAVAWNETALQSTTAASSPSPELVQAGNGTLYGTTSGGGAFGYGSIFAFEPATNALQVIYSFAGPDGARPRSGLTVGIDGYLYGVTAEGGGANWLSGTGPRGTVFRFDPATGVLTTLHVFSFVPGHPVNALPMGSTPEGRLLQASDGLLYGTTSFQGPGGQGTVFRIDPATGTFSTVHAFSGADGAWPHAGVTEGPDRALYGVTFSGGASNLGTVFRLDQTGALATLHAFSGPDGQGPTAELLVAPGGSIYGTTNSGGAHNYGTAFVVSPAGEFTSLHSFAGTTAEGGNPVAPMVRLQDGDLYGIAPVPGHPWASLFSLTPGGSFASGISLLMLNTRGLLQGDDGSIYGVSPSSNLRITRLTPPPSATVAARQAQVPLVVSGAPASAVFAATFTVSATGGSGTGAVTFTTTGACTSSGPVVTMTSGTGTCAITAAKAGDATYAEATSPPAMVTALLAPSVPLTIAGAPERALPGTTFEVTVSGGSGIGALDVSVDGSCTFDAGSGQVTTIEPFGTCTITATKASDGNFAAASTAALVIVEAVQAPLAIRAPAFAVYGTGFTVSTAGGSGDGAVTFTASGACENTDGGPAVTMTSGTGVCEIGATKDGDGTYPPVDAPAVTVAARRAQQAPLALSGAPDYAPFGTIFPIEVTGGSGTGALTVLTTAGCGVLENDPPTVLMVMTSGSVECGISVLKGDDENYEPRLTPPDFSQWWEDEILQGLPHGAGAAGLVSGGNGLLFGASVNAGVFGRGGIFQYDPATNSLEFLHLFDGTDGYWPGPWLTIGADGNLYGVTEEGGGTDLDPATGPRGTVFKLDPGSRTLTTLHVFAQTAGPGAPAGVVPVGPVLQASDGMLYGATSESRPSGLGTIFRLDPQTGVLTTLHVFSGLDGASPAAGLVELPDGALVGTTVGGGAHNHGTVFRIEKTGALTTLHSFNGPGGSSPRATLRPAADGSLIGTTSWGGAFGGGTVFALFADGQLTTLHSFTGGASGAPSGELSRGLDGQFYGLAGNYLFSVADDGTVSTGGPNLPGMSLSPAEDGTWYGASGASGSLLISRLKRPPSAVVWSEQIEQSPLAVAGAPATAENGSTFAVTVLGGSVPWAFDVYVDGVCMVDYNDGVSFLVTMTDDTGTCTIVAYNWGDDDHYYAESEPVAVGAVPATVPGTAPVITSLSPATGTVDGGVVVTLRGSHFTPDATVTFGGVEAASVVVEDEWTLHAETPRHPVASVDVAVTTAGGTLTTVAPRAFAYGPAPAVGLHGPVVRANVRPGGATGYVTGGALSADGRFVAFVAADDGVGGPGYFKPQVFVRDVEQSTTEQVNVTSSGQAVQDGWALDGPVFVSNTGKYVVFTTLEALVPGDTNGQADAYVRNREDGTTVRVSVTPGGGQIAADIVHAGPITPDGRFVTFVASGTGVTPQDVFPGSDVFVRDLVAGTTTMISVTDGGFPANGASDAPSISDDGRYVAFASTATNLAAGGAWNVFVRDRDADTDGVFDEAGAVTTTLVSASAPGVGGNQASTRPSVSADGNLVVFQSLATNLVAGDTNGVQDVLLHDRQAGGLERISLRPGGAQAQRASSLSEFGRTVSANGRFVVFASADAGLVPFDGNLAPDIFRFDRADGSIALVSARKDGARTEAAGITDPPVSLNGVISADGRQVLFASDATNLLEDPVNGDTNGGRDLFVKTLQLNTPAGPSDGEPIAVVDPSTGGSPVLIEFSFVSEEGTTSLTRLEEPPPLPTGFSVAGVVYDISTTAVLPQGVAIEICISYAGLDVGDESSLKLMHFEDGEWRNITTEVRSAQKLVCGATMSLSPFTIAVPLPTAVSVSATGSLFGGQTTLSATVTPAGVPGSVTFSVDGGEPMAGSYDEITGVATITSYVHGLPAGASPYPVRAVFTSAAVNYANSTVTEAVLSVGQLLPVITFGAVPSAAYLGSDFAVTAATTNADSPLIAFSVASGPCELVGGSTFRATGAGTCVVRAEGPATVNFTAATAEQAVPIDRAATTTVLTSTPNPSSPGQAVVFTATVSSAAGPVTVGSVTFRLGSTVLGGPAALDGSGIAMFSTSALAAGAHLVTAEYGATMDFGASSRSVTHTVEGATTYSFSGFFAPIDMPLEGVTVWNTATAGQAIPVKWLLTLAGAPVSSPASFLGVFSYAVSCSSGAGSIETVIEEYATGNTTLSYLGDGHWQYNWKTPKNYAKTCRAMFVKFNDGTSSPLAYFKFK